MGAAKHKRGKHAPPTSTEIEAAVAALRATLATRPILMLHDASLPSVTTILAGEVIAGSWWGHPRGALIFETMQRIETEVAWPKLVRGQVTLVHRPCWPALVAACRDEEPWQMRGLPRDARELYEQVLGAGSARTDRLRETGDVLIVGRSVDQLEKRLLVMSAQVHTASGKHARELSTWQRWQQRSGLATTTLPSGESARATLESHVADFDRRGAPLMPWMGDAK